MKLEIKVIPGAKKNAFKEEAGGIKVYLTSPPVDGKANKALVSFLAGHFKVKSSAVKIVKGFKSRQKVVDIVV